MINIVSEPPLVSLSGLPVIFKVSSDKFDEPYFRIKAVPYPGQEEYLPLHPATDVATFDLREYFAADLAVSLKLSAHLHANAAKSYNVVFHEFYGNPPTEHANDSCTIVVVRGTIPRWRINAFASFAAWQASNLFHTFAPTSKRVLPTQPELLYFLAPSSGTFSPAVVITFTDGSTASHSPAVSITGQALQMLSLPVGYSALGIAAVNPSKKVASYTVTISGRSRTYVVDHTPYADVRFLLFRNSLGGYDCLPLTGEADEHTELSRDMAEHVYDAEAVVQQFNKRTYNIQHAELVKANSGWLLSAERDWLNDLLISEDIYELYSGTLSPVLMRSTSLDRTKRNYEPGSVEIEYERLSLAV